MREVAQLQQEIAEVEASYAEESVGGDKIEGSLVGTSSGSGAATLE